LGTSTVTGNQSDFSTDPGSISAGNCTGTWNSGTQDFTLTLLGTDFARVQYASKIVAGNKYIVTFKMKSSNYTTGYPTVRDNATDGVRVSGGLLTADYQQYCYTLTAVSTYIQIGITSTVGKDCTIDDISVRPLTGLIAAYSMKPVNSILTDISGNGKNGTVSGGVVSTKDGMLFNGTSGKISSTYTANINSLSFRIKPSVNYTTVPIIIRLGSSGNIYYNQTTGIISYQSGGIGDKNPVTYINGILDSTKTMKLNEWNNVTINFDTYTTSTVIMGSDGSSSFGGIELADLRIYNRVLSLQEIKDYSNSFVKPVIAEDFSSEPADGTAIVPTGWQQVSGTTKIGEINIARGELVTNGNFDSGTTGWSLGVEWTVSGGKAVCDGTQTSNTLLQQVPGVTIGKTYKYSFEVVNYISGSLINYIAGVSLSSKSSNGIYTGIVVATADFIRFYGAVGFAGSIDNVSIVEIDPSLTVKQGTKFIEQVTAGVLAIPSETAYGEWSFDWMKGADGNNLYISFINNTNSLFTSTYSFIASNNEAVGLLKNGSSSGMGITANSYITNNTWYRIKITRSTAGAFTVLIKGGAFTATAGYDGWTLVSVTGGSGSNPVTDQTYSSSNYFVLDLDALDRVANIVISNGIKQ